MIRPEILIEAEGWTAFGPEFLALRAFDAATAEIGEEVSAGTVSCLFACDAEVQRLNATWRGKDRPTNVLSFPAEPLPGLPEQEEQPLGDIALALGTVEREAAEKGIAADAHITHLLVHGLLHLIGYDHIDADDARQMESLETRILARLGIADPYGDARPEDDGDSDA